MLRDKSRMTAPRRLFAIVRRLRRRETSGDKIRGMLEDDFEPFAREIFPVVLV